jgi:hypothetical protein
MNVPSSLAALLGHPAPGLHFPVHPRIPESRPHIIPAPHRANRTPSRGALDRLCRITDHAPSLQYDLLSVYSTHNGVELCRILHNDLARPALAIHPIEYWDMWTQQLDITFDSFLTDLRNVYIPGNYHVIGGCDTEGTNLVLFTRGEYEGRALAGTVFRVALDGYLGYLEPLARSFADLIGQIGTDPLPILAKFPWTHTATNSSGQHFGAVPDRYVADIRGEPDVKTELAPPDEPPEEIPDILRL